MSSKVENVEKNVVKLTITVPNEKFLEALKKSYKKNVGKLNIPGFRKGKAPQTIIEKYYGESVLFEDAIDFCVPEAYEAAIDETKIDPVGKPELDVTQIGSKEDLIFTITVTVKPEVTVTDYKGVSIEKIEHLVTDADIDAELSAMQEKNSRLISVTDKLAQNGDTIVMDFEGSVDGVLFEGGTATDYSYVIGSGQFIPGFEEQLVGKAIDEPIDVTVTFPEEYHSEELKGKPALFKCVIHSIKTKELPTLDDEFAKDVSEFDTLEELKSDIKARLTKDAEIKTKADKENAVIDKILENLVADIPECMIETQLDNILRDYSMRMSQQGLSLEQFMQYTGNTIETFREQFKPQAEKQVKINLALEKIAELENPNVTDEDLEAELERVAQMYKIEIAQVKEGLKEEDMENIKKDLKVSKVLEILVASAKEEAVASKKPTKSKKEKAVDSE